MKTRIRATGIVLALACISVIFLPSVALADHAWGPYHWARTANPFNLKVVDSHTPDWDDNYNRALGDWTQSTVLNLVGIAGTDARQTRKRCPMVSGQVRSCNAEYGFNGWLGLASINITGGQHITQGTSKMNDSYFKSPSYNETARSHVVCQEIGHTFGLGHQDESGADLNTCMDYSNNLDNPSPNSHDYQQLQTIYAHLDTFTTVGFASLFESMVFDDDADAPHKWGRLVEQSANGRSSTYEQDHGNGSKTLRHVFWTEEFAERCRGCDHRYDH